MTLVRILVRRWHDWRLHGRRPCRYPPSGGSFSRIGETSPVPVAGRHCARGWYAESSIFSSSRPIGAGHPCLAALRRAASAAHGSHRP